MNLEELKAQPRWLCHKNKVPLSGRTGGAGSSTDPATWADFATATATAKRFRLDGVGLVFTGDDIVGIDLDKCIGDNEGTTVCISSAPPRFPKRPKRSFTASASKCTTLAATSHGQAK